MKLDAKSVAALALDGKTDAIHFDDALTGFGYRLRRGAGGKTLLRTWVVQYRHAGGTRRMLLGSAEVLGAEQARAAAKKVLARVALGEDPSADRADRRGKDRLTVRACVAEFLAVKKGELAPRSFVETKRYLTDPRYFGPMHSMPIDAVSRKDVAARTVVIARECGSPTASRARGALGGFFSWCLRMGFIEVNPTVGAHTPAEPKPRDRVLSDGELAAIWKACGDDDYGKVVRLLALGAWRRAEIGDLVWTELDFEAGTITIPAARNKSGRAHSLPLMPMMRRILESVPRMASRPQLFGVHSHGFTAWHKGKAALDARLGDAVGEWRLHDVRRSAATRMGDLKVAPHVVERILGHAFGDTVARTYNRSLYDNEVRAALAVWEAHILSLVEGGERKVLPFSTAS